ncbi:malonyl-ACP O-methyltransferase BioC [Facilibium subflavum]|uniref:hypothetical protein n=1 Tax=Facilibium subflavum TaxID=2219058 RepID=UPI000E6532AE|nr:hypothetical protein [Facilibium subflavum]
MFDYQLFKQLKAKKRVGDQHQGFIKGEIADRLLDKLSFIKISPQKIYLEGEFSQSQRQMLALAYPMAKLTDTLSSGTDIILSNCQLHQTQSIDKKLTHYYAHLSKKGVLLLSTFGSTSLQEIKKAWRLIDSTPHINQMLDMHDLGDILLNHQFQTPVVDAEHLQLNYQTIQGMIEDIRQLHEPLADTKMRKTLTGKNRWQQFIKRLEKQGLSINYEIVYAYAQKPERLLAKKQDEQTSLISFEMLKNTLRK